MTNGGQGRGLFIDEGQEIFMLASGDKLLLVFLKHESIDISFSIPIFHNYSNQKSEENTLYYYINFL